MPRPPHPTPVCAGWHLPNAGGDRAWSIEAAPGYLSVVQARAAIHGSERGAYLVPFGGVDECATLAIAGAARSSRIRPLR